MLTALQNGRVFVLAICESVYVNSQHQNEQACLKCVVINVKVLTVTKQTVAPCETDKHCLQQTCQVATERTQGTTSEYAERPGPTAV